jgi:hypothetical protein
MYMQSQNVRPKNACAVDQLIDEAVHLLRRRCPWRKRHIKWPFGNRLTFENLHKSFMLSRRVLQAAARVQSQDSCWLQCATQDKSLKENIRGTFTVLPRS